jgi:DTW domain-containing protein YfiP
VNRLKNEDPAPTTRDFCYKCWRVQTLCLCEYIKPIRSNTEIVILQHPNEKKMPYNTARLAHLCLDNSQLINGIDFSLNKAFLDLIPEDLSEIGILFPSENAKELSDAPPLKKLVVIDGTWSEARKILFNNPILKTLPQYQFTPEKPSNYRIRKEPLPNYISSIEAIVQSLRILEKDDSKFQHLLDIFDRMVDRQVDFLHINPRHSNRFQRNKDRKNIGQIKWILFSLHPTERLEKLAEFEEGQIDGLKNLALELWGVKDIFSEDILIPKLEK